MVQLQVENYQSIKKAVLSIEGLTIVKGASNSGKSSVFKAFYSAVFNRFRGGCVRFGEDVCKVKIKYSDSDNILAVERSAAGASPRMALGNKDKGYIRFDKLNREVPVEIREFHNFGKIKASTSDDVYLNFTPQFAPPLLIQFTPRKIAELLATSQASQDMLKAKKVLDADNLYLKGAFENLNSVISETKSQVHTKNLALSRFKNASKVEKALKNLEVAEERLVNLEALQTLLERKYADSKRLVNLEALQTVLGEAVKSVNKYNTIYELLEEFKCATALNHSLVKLKKLSSTVSEAKLLSKEFEFRSELVYEMKILCSFRKKLELCQSVLEKRDSLNRVEGSFQLYSTMVELVKDQNLLKRSTLAWEKVTEVSKLNLKLGNIVELIEVIKSLNLHNKDLETLLDSQKRGVCPFCGHAHSK